MGVSKTRNVLLDAARKLFGSIGFDNITMNDIAVESQKGRRTLYTYFKNKDEIYWTVIKEELNRFLDTLENVAKQRIPPEQKLFKYIKARMNSVSIIIERNGSLKADFFNNPREIAQIRVRVDIREHHIIRDILTDGVKAGVFDISNVYSVATIIQNALKGSEVPYTRKRTRQELINQKDEIFRFILNGIKSYK